MTNSRAKGARGEREFVQYLADFDIEARRGQQYKGTPDSPDIEILDKDIAELLHFEVKRTERLRLYEAVEQADKEAGDFRYPVVAHRKNGEDWLAIMPMEDFLDFVITYLQERNHL